MTKSGTNEVQNSPPPSPAATNGSYSPQRVGFSPSSYTSQQPILNNTYSTNGNYSPNKLSNLSVEKSDALYSGSVTSSVYAVPSQQQNGHASPPQKGSSNTLSNLHYRSLQTAAVIAPRGQVQPLNGFSQRSNSTETSQRKRYHTAPREKHRVGANF